MKLPYTNRKNRKYYLKQRTTKKGNPQYFFSSLSGGQVLHTIPKGYEIYENPGAQVFLVKSDSIKITQLEKELLRAKIPKISRMKYSIVDAKKNILAVYIPNQNIEALETIFESGQTSQELNKESFFNEALTYSAALRFVLINEEKRLFQTECCLPASLEWVDIGDSGSLNSLIDEHVPNLDQNAISERRWNEVLERYSFLRENL